MGMKSEDMESEPLHDAALVDSPHRCFALEKHYSMMSKSRPGVACLAGEWRRPPNDLQDGRSFGVAICLAFGGILWAQEQHVGGGHNSIHDDSTAAQAWTSLQPCRSARSALSDADSTGRPEACANPWNRSLVPIDAALAAGHDVRQPGFLKPGRFA